MKVILFFCATVVKVRTLLGLCGVHFQGAHLRNTVGGICAFKEPILL